jgi:hypothetical protein
MRPGFCSAVLGLIVATWLPVDAQLPFELQEAAITVPMGYVHRDLPIGLEVLSIPWSEPTLNKLVYSYEQATKHRRHPLRCRRWLLAACQPRGNDVDSSSR